jgi:flagellar basal-body rod protein FlgB
VPFAGVDTTRLLVEAMKVTQENHRILANNIANVDTPNFNPTELDFQATLRNAIEGRGRISLRRTQPQHFERVVHRPEFERLGFLSKNDYNKVDLDDQMAKLAENTGRYTTYASLVIKQFEEVKNMLTALR